MGCHTRFTTYERVYNPRLMVAKRSGPREPFSSAKLERSIALACTKRPLPPGTVERLASDVQDALTDDGKETVESSIIGEIVLVKLRDLDQVAYMRFASVYRDFDAPGRFAEELAELAGDLPGHDRSQARLLGSDALARAGDEHGQDPSGQ